MTENLGPMTQDSDSLEDKRAWLRARLHAVEYELRSLCDDISYMVNVSVISYEGNNRGWSTYRKDVRPHPGFTHALAVKVSNAIKSIGAQIQSLRPVYFRLGTCERKYRSKSHA